MPELEEAGVMVAAGVGVVMVMVGVGTGAMTAGVVATTAGVVMIVGASASVSAGLTALVLDGTGRTVMVE